jgi:hypothetical protein
MLMDVPSRTPPFAAEWAAERGAPTPRAAAPPRGIASLTGIRGVAAVWVFLTHYQAVMAGYLQSPAIGANRFMYNGFRGVDLFFALSGFILMHVHGQDFHRVEAGPLRRFYILRGFRVVPLNTAVLLALVPLVLTLPGLVDWFRVDHGAPIPYHARDFSAAGFVQSLLLAQTWTFAKLGEWNGPAWSLSAEVFGYAIFPLLARMLIRRNAATFCAAAALASLSLLMVLLAVGGHAQDRHVRPDPHDLLLHRRHEPGALLPAPAGFGPRRARPRLGVARLDRRRPRRRLGQHVRGVRLLRVDPGAGVSARRHRRAAVERPGDVPRPDFILALHGALHPAQAVPVAAVDAARRRRPRAARRLSRRDPAALPRPRRRDPPRH